MYDGIFDQMYDHVDGALNDGSDVQDNTHNPPLWLVKICDAITPWYL